MRQRRNLPELPDASRWLLASRLLAIVGVLALLLAGCSPGEVDETDDPLGEEPAEGEEPADDEEPTEGEPIELTVWFGREHVIPPDNFAGFQEQYPHITVNTDVVDLDDVFETLVRMQDAGQALPDVIHMDGFFMPGLYEAGIIRDIGEYVDRWEQEDPESFGQLHEVVWEDGVWDGVQVAMAPDAGFDQIWYRPDWFEELGIGIPTTHDGVLDAMRAIKEGKPDVLPFSMAAARGEGVNFWITHMEAVGVPFEGATPQMDTEAGHYIIDFYQTVVREELTSPDILAWGSDEYRGAFIGGRSAMMIDSIGVAEDLEPVEDMNCDEQWALYDIPIESMTDEGQVVATAKAWAISTDTEHPYEASLVFRYLMEFDNALSLALFGDIPRHTAVLESDEFRGKFPCFVPHIDTFLSTENFPLATNFFAVQNTMELMLQDLIQNPNEPPEVIAERWQPELDALTP